jgi:F-box protein 21
MLDDLVSEFRSQHGISVDMSIRQKALALNRWLRDNNLVGLERPGEDYRNLRNCFIGQALQDEHHPSLPVISSAIYCCMAARLGLVAQCCPFPGNIHVIVFANQTATLDGRPVQNPQSPIEKMYLDPFGSSEEVELAYMRGVLSQTALGSATEEFFLNPASPAFLATRVAFNITETYKMVYRRHRRGMQPSRELTAFLGGNSGMNVEAAAYASFWVSLFTSRDLGMEFGMLDDFLQQFGRWWPEDAWLVEEYILPRFPPCPRLGDARPAYVLDQVKDFDLNPVVHRRRRDRDPRFKVGQVVLHKRYGYVGIVVGWEAGELATLSTTIGPGDWDERLGSGIFYALL